jgi:hypothetical protein
MNFEPTLVDALPVKQRGTPPFWRGTLDFTAMMEEMYQAIERHAHEVVLGQEPRS